MSDAQTESTVEMDTLVSLCKRRGFVFPSSEIYGGFESTWDYGPLGVELKQNVKRAWWKAMVQERDDMVGLDTSILMSPKVWEASGHTSHFTDALVECQDCRRRFREDEIGQQKEDGAAKSASDVCPQCSGHLTAARQFNTMFKTFVGPVEEEASVPRRAVRSAQTNAMLSAGTTEPRLQQ